MQTKRWLVVACALALSACGSDENAAAQPGAAKQRAAAEDMTAEQVAKEARGKMKCPAKVASRAPRVAGAVDVVGVWPGMTYEEAQSTVLCTHDLLVTGPTNRSFRIQTYGQTVRQGFEANFAQPKVNSQKSARDYRREWEQAASAIASNRRREAMPPGTATWYVATMGMPGEERVINVGRKERFEEGRQPTRESVRTALIKKYGEPTEAFEQPPRAHLFWSYDTRGRRITETSPLFRRCQAPTSIEAAFNFSPECGFTLAATIQALPSNSDLTDELTVTSLDQAGGYEAIERTERGLAALDAQRRAKETEAASRNATAPTL